MGLVEAITLKGNAEREKYLSVLEVIDIINSHKKNDIDEVISVMDSVGLFSLTVYELNSSDPYNPIYNPIDKPICSSYELKQKIRDYRKVAGQLDNYSEGKVFDEYMTLQRFIRNILWSRFDLLKIEAIAKHTNLVVWSNSNALYITYSDIINKTDSEYYALPQSTQQAIRDYIAEPEQVSADAEATGSFQMGTPTIAHGEPKTYEQVVEALTAANAEIRQHKQTINRLSDQVDKSSEDKMLPYNSQISVAKMLYAILTEHNYDLSATRGKANSLIEKASQLHGTSVTRNFIAQWIDLANQAKNDSTK